MILEIDNILRAVGDIRKATLSLAAKMKTAEQKKIAADLMAEADQMEFSTRVLEFEMNISRGEGASFAALPRRNGSRQEGLENV